MSRHALAITDEGVAFREVGLRLKRMDKEELLSGIKPDTRALPRVSGSPTHETIGATRGASRDTF